MKKEDKVYTLLQTQKLNNKLLFPKQSLRTIAVTHAEQFSQNTNSIKNRGRQAAIHTLKRKFLADRVIKKLE